MVDSEMKSSSSIFIVPDEKLNKKNKPSVDNTVNFYSDFLELKNTLEKAENDLRDNIKEIKDTKSLVIIGFIALVVVVMLTIFGLIAGYWTYVYDSVRKDDYKYGFSEKINAQAAKVNNLEEENKKLQNVINCQKNKKYWEYDKCFQ